MLRSVDSSVRQPVELRPSTQTAKTEGGEKPLATYTSKADGSERSVAITSPSQKISDTEIAAIRDSFKQNFGETATGLAFRMIDQRLGDEAEIRGEHVLAANMVAMECVSPGIGFAREKLAAEGDVQDARKELDAAKKELQLATANHEQRSKDLGDEPFSMLRHGLYKEKEDASTRLETATRRLAKAEKGLEKAEKSLSSATEKLETFKGALDQPLRRSDDEVRLKTSKSGAESWVGSAQERLADARLELEAAKKEVESRTLSPEDPNWESRWLPGFTKPLADARERLAKAKEEVAEARADLKDAQTHLDDVDTRLSALQSGPLYRRAQAMLDHVGQDKRFMDILDDMAPGKATGGGLGKLESVINKDIYGKVLEKAVTTALPPLGIANLFRSAIKAEDCERRLDSASKHMGDAPLAKGLATSLAHAKEAEKWKLGIEGTIGFVGMALTMKGASAVGTLMQPAMLVVNKAVEHGTQPLGWIVGGAVSKITESVVEGLPDMVFEKAGNTVLDKASDSNAQGMERAELVRTLKAMEVPEGTSMPVIPVKPYGSSHSAERVLPLSDPQVGIAFLAYLGPKADEGMLRDPGKREMEERRLQLREEMFGAGRSEDLRPGTKVDGDKDLVSQLDRGPGQQGRSSVGGASPLHLLHAGLGWTT
jgi:hypothetical protein